MKMSMMILLLTSLVSCDSIPYKPIYQYKHFSDSCAIRCFDYNELKVTKDKDCGKDFKTNLKLPSEFCNGMIGPAIVDYAEDIKPAALEAIQKCIDEMD